MMEDTGFLIRENVFTSSECDELLDTIDRERSKDGRAGIRHLMSVRSVSRLASDPRLITLTQQITGKPLSPYKATLFDKTGKANWLVAWHQDLSLPLENFNDEKWGPWSRK